MNRFMISSCIQKNMPGVKTDQSGWLLVTLTVNQWYDVIKQDSILIDIKTNRSQIKKHWVKVKVKVKMILYLQTISNRVCVGQCFSYSVPQSVPANVYDDRLHYCDSCQPKNSTWIKVEDLLLK